MEKIAGGLSRVWRWIYYGYIAHDWSEFFHRNWKML